MRAGIAGAGRRQIRHAIRQHLVQAQPVQGKHGISFRNQGQQLPGTAGAAALQRDPVVNPVLLAKAVQEPCFKEHLQMSRHPRLALAQNAGQLAHGELSPRAQREQAQPGWLGHGLQGSE